MRKTDKKYFEKMVEDKDLVKESFNTDDGIRRAAIPRLARGSVGLPAFQYR